MHLQRPLISKLVGKFAAVFTRKQSPRPVDLQRFLEAQSDVYLEARRQLESGQKTGHWMWFMFPNLDGLGKSIYARKYAICSLEEAKAYLEHPVLGARLVRLAEIILAHEDKSAFDIFGTPDDLKLLSCMTLFDGISPESGVFAAVLDQFFGGAKCPHTRAALSTGGRLSR